MRRRGLAGVLTVVFLALLAHQGFSFRKGADVIQALGLESVSTQLLFVTARLETVDGSGNTSQGTAFLFEYGTKDGKRIPVLVTNRHVIENQTSGRFLLHEGKKAKDGKVLPTERSFPVDIAKDFSSQWLCHPDPKVDLCVMLAGPIFQLAHKSGFEVYMPPLSEALIPSDEAIGKLNAMEQVTMAGYPIGLYDKVHNLPILRQGHTASHPAVDFNGEPKALVDMACFPGSSGSPVLIVNEGSYVEGNAIVMGVRVMLLGILFAGPNFGASGDIHVVDIPTVKSPKALTMIPTHMGYYVKARELLTLKKELFRRLNVS